MKHFLRIHILFTLLVLGNAPSWTQKDIKSKKTKSHQLIKGTKVSMIPPNGFEESHTFNGYKNGSSEATLMVLPMPVGFTKSIEGVNKESLEKQGLKNIQIHNIKVNSLLGLYITGTQSLYGMEFEKTLLFFGNEKESVVLNTAYNSKNIEEGKAINKSINSVFFDADLELDPFANLDYHFTKPTLKFARVLNSSVVYNVDGILPSKESNRTSLMASKAAVPEKIDDKKNFAYNRLFKFNIILENVILYEEKVVDNLPAVEIIVSGKEKSSGQVAQFHQLMVFAEKEYYITFGITNQDFEKNISLIKDMSLSFQRKK